MAQPPPSRVGLELEMHGIRLSFRRRGTNTFWPVPPQGVLYKSTMIAMDTILKPLNEGDGFLQLPPAPANTIKWESNWGFRAVGDGFGATMITPGGVAANAAQGVYCVLELATAACPVTDYAYVGQALTINLVTTSKQYS
jgi:hypothetical protein